MPTYKELWTKQRSLARKCLKPLAEYINYMSKHGGISLPVRAYDCKKQMEEIIEHNTKELEKLKK